MDKFYKIMDGKYIAAVGVNSGGVEISEKEYLEILELINKQYSSKSADKWYRLRDDLTWEEIDPPKPEKDGEK